MPRGLVVSNGSNSRSDSSGATPGPSSSTRKIASSPRLSTLHPDVSRRLRTGLRHLDGVDHQVVQRLLDRDAVGERAERTLGRLEKHVHPLGVRVHFVHRHDFSRNGGKVHVLKIQRAAGDEFANARDDLARAARLGLGLFQDAGDGLLRPGPAVSMRLAP